MNRFSIRLLSLVLVLLWASPAIGQTAPEPLAELDRLLAELPRERSTAVALAKVEALGRLSGWVPRADFAARIDAAARSINDPRVAFVLHQKAAWAFAELKDKRYGGHGMTGPLASQGCLRDWEVVGPFDNPSNEGFTNTLGPELGEVGPYPGKLVEVDWRPLGEDDRFCEFNLNRPVEPSTAAVAFLGGTVASKRAQAGLLSVGANGAYKIWVNGELVADRGIDTGMSVDSDAWPVKLRAGENSVLVKLGSTQDGGLGFVARLVDNKFRPIAFQMRAKSKPTATKTGEPKEDKRAMHLKIEANAESMTGDDAVWNAWHWRSVAWQNVAVPWRDVAEKLLEKPESLSPFTQALLAELFEEYWRRVEIIEAAANRAPNDPWIAARVAATLEDSLAEPDKLRALSLYIKLTKEHPGFLPAHGYLADWYNTAGFSERGLAVLEAVKHPNRMQIPGFATRLTSLERSAGNIVEAERLEAETWKVTFVSSGFTWNVVRDLAQANKIDEALKAIEEYREFVPRSRYADMKEAELRRASGDTAGAMTIYKELQRQAPGDPDLFELEAKLLLTSGKVSEGLTAYREALKRRPQDQSLRDFIAFLQPKKDRQFESWLVEDPRELAASFEPSPFNYDSILENSVTFVSKNGLASTVFQRVDRVLNPEGVDAAKTHRASYQMGDEEAEVLAVRVYKPDGTVSEDYEQWDSGGTRKASTTYNDSGTITMQANDVEVGDLVEFRYRVSQVANENFRGDYFGDIAYLQGARPIALQRWAVVYPDNWELYFRTPKIEHQRIDGVDPRGKVAAPGFKSTSFEMTNVPYIESDPGQPGFSDVYDYLLVSNKKTYDEVGKWWWNLIEEQLIVDEPIRKKVAELTRGLKKPEDKVRAIHNYVVRNTRYLHVGLGIHGWKPYRTSTCFRNRYGDCKDKASLMKVMLEAAGVKANLVLVRTRRLGTVEEMPASMHIFNHAITYVPSMDLFLDGTAEFNGTTELTTMDQGAQALIVEDGGNAHIVTLPIDKPENNTMRTELEIDLSKEEPVAKGKIVAKGANAVYFRQSLEDPERRDEALEKQLADEFPGAKLVDAEYRNLSDLEKSPEIDFTMKGGQLLRDDGTRQFVFPVGRPKSLLDAYAKRSKRNQDLTIRVPFTNVTKIRYRLGPSKKFDNIPANSDKKSKFGSLSIQYDKDGDDLVVDVSYSLAEQRIAVEDYPEFRKFLADVTAALNDSIAVTEAK